MKNKRVLVIFLSIIVIVVVIVLISWPSMSKNTFNTNTPQTQNTNNNTPNSSITLSISPTPELPGVSMNDFLASCGKSSDNFVAHINTYTDQSLEDKIWVDNLKTKIDDVEKSCTTLAISDGNQIPSQVLYLRALASQKFPEAITLFREGINIKEKTIILAAISKFRDATNLLIGTSYFASSLASVTPPSPQATKSIDEQYAEEAMNKYVITCSPAMEDLNSYLGLYTSDSLTNTPWIQSFNTKLDAFDKACNIYSVATPPIELQAVDFILKMGSQKCTESSLIMRDSVTMEDPLGFVLGISQFRDARFLLAGAVAYGK